MLSTKPDRLKAAEIVRDVGGSIVGRTRLQKVAYLMELAGLGDGFSFEYRHYGPYSEELAEGIRTAQAFGLVQEEERATEWGGFYSVYRVGQELGERDEARAAFASAAAQISAIELELLATAAYLRVEENSADPWEETARLKPEKAGHGRLERARKVYRKLLAVPTPRPLPQIA